MQVPPKVTCEKPALPTLWIDTSVIINIAKVQHGLVHDQITIDRTNQLRALVEELTQKNRLLCPQADQEEEYTAYSLDREIHGEFLSLSVGVRMRHRQGVSDYHAMMGMRAYIEGAPEIVIPASSFFYGNPVEEQTAALGRPFLIGTHPIMVPDEIQRRATGKEQVQQAWEQLRQEFVANRVSYDAQLIAEESGYADTIGDRLVRFHASIAAGKSDMWDFLGVEDILMFNVYWKDIGGKPDGLAGLEQFFRTRYFNNLPLTRVKAQLGADLLTGDQKIVPSDVMDVELMGAAIPISHFVLTDRRVALRVKRRGIDQEWNTEVFSLQTIDDLFIGLREL